VSILPHRSGVCSVEVIIEVAVPLSVPLDSDATILARATLLEFSP
jgi:hypothetical protein